MANYDTDRIIYKNDADSAQVLADIIFGQKQQSPGDKLLMLQGRVMQKIVDTILYEGEEAAKRLIYEIKCRLEQL